MHHCGDFDLCLLKSHILAFLKIKSAVKNERKLFRQKNKALESQLDYKQKVIVYEICS